MNTAFTEALPPFKLISLDVYDSFEKKFDVVYEIAIVPQLYVEVSNENDVAPIPKDILQVITMANHPGDSAYMLSLLNDYYDLLKESLKSYVQGPDDFDTITKTLERFIEICDDGMEKNDIKSRFTFDQSLILQVYKGGCWVPVKYQYINCDEKLINHEFSAQFDIRKGFFKAMGRTLKDTIVLHKSDPVSPIKPYVWNSPNAELEISELLYIIYRTSGQLEFDADKGGSFPKFKRDFMGLFGLSDKNYDKKVIEIKKRKKGEHFINRLADLFGNEVN